MTRYKGYRPGTIRHDDWEYRRAAWYFVTICTEHRRPFFGRVRNGIIGQYKSVCTKQIRRHGKTDFEWQSRFYDKIIRTRRAFRAVRRYIQNHPDE